jgi:hypothetical protein
MSKSNLFFVHVACVKTIIKVNYWQSPVYF